MKDVVMATALPSSLKQAKEDEGGGVAITTFPTPDTNSNQKGSLKGEKYHIPIGTSSRAVFLKAAKNPVWIQQVGEKACVN